MQGEVLGRRYAKALFELTKTDPACSVIAEFLTLLGRELGARGPMADACLNPRYPMEAKRELLAKAAERADVGEIGRKFLGLLLKKNRLSFLPAIAGAYQALLDAEAGRRRVTVTAARPLDQKEQDALAQRLESVTGQTVNLDVAVDDGILGGVVIRSGSLYYDASLRGQLERMRRQLVSM